VLINQGWNENHPDKRLKLPGPSVLGCIGIFAGLALLLLDTHVSRGGADEDDELESVSKRSSSNMNSTR
jgi:hypothetical protein